MIEASPVAAAEFIANSSFQWHQRFELASGVYTPGLNPISYLFASSTVPGRLEGTSVLDIGTTNGAAAFECERRGASRVVAVDIVSDEHFGFTALAKFLGSEVEFVRASVYELADALNGETFDVVIFWGVLYHLRHPLLGLDSVRRLARGLVSLETAVCNHSDGNPGPLARFHRLDDLGADGSNWWSPTTSALRDWVASAGFVVGNFVTWPNESQAQRCLVDMAVDGDAPEYLRVSYERPLRLQPVVHDPCAG